MNIIQSLFISVMLFNYGVAVSPRLLNSLIHQQISEIAEVYGVGTRFVYVIYFWISEKNKLKVGQNYIDTQVTVMSKSKHAVRGQ